MDQFWIKKDPTNSFRRPENPEDIRYRKIKRMTFEDELKSVLPKSCDLCFHGTTIWNTKAIIESGEISARIDRESGDEILDTPGQIYVTTLHNVWFTIKHHADLNNYKYPAGSIFVLSPKDEEELISAKENNLISNVNLKENPERLVAIITTPENTDRVKNWIHNSNIKTNPDIVVDYDNAVKLITNQLESHKEK